MKPPTKQEKAHMDRIGAMGCIVCGHDAEIHHVTASVHGGRISRSHWLIVPLCPVHHRTGPDSVEALSHGGFARHHGIDLLAWAADNAGPEFWNDARRMRDPAFAAAMGDRMKNA